MAEPLALSYVPARRAASAAALDVVCLSHLRWDFVFQRPQHLLTRCARQHRVFYVEEPLAAEGPPRLDIHVRQQDIRMVVPRLPALLGGAEQRTVLAGLIEQLLETQAVTDYLLWYYTPMALEFTRQLRPRGVVYDCMDELSAFLGAPPEMRAREQELLRRADVVFTGGQALFEKKRNDHPNVHAFPSSVDVAHFARARMAHHEPADQEPIPHPRLGFFGVLDERLDTALISELAEMRPDWHVVLVGPIAKIDPGTLPSGTNIHYLGPKSYEELPAYIAGWDVALLPFARNAATRFISPTKTPEYLAAGRPVVSTPIRDVVRPYGVKGLVRIAETAEEFAAAVEMALAEDPVRRQREVDAFLTQTSWDGTWTRMHRLIVDAIDCKDAAIAAGTPVSQPGVA